MDCAVFGKQAVLVSAYSDDRYLHVKDHRDEPQQLICVPGVAYCHHDIVACHNSEVSVVNVEGVYEERRRAGA